MKKILIIALMCCVCAEARAQQGEAEFTADRPGASRGWDRFWLYLCWLISPFRVQQARGR